MKNRVSWSKIWRTRALTNLYASASSHFAAMRISAAVDGISSFAISQTAAARRERKQLHEDARRKLATLLTERRIVDEMEKKFSACWPSA